MPAPHAMSTVRDLRLVAGLGLADSERASLPEALADKVEGELQAFAAHMRHGLLSAATNVGGTSSTSCSRPS
jgi:hypothetical protein